MRGAPLRATVVGGGVIGMAIALELAQVAVECTLIDPSPGRGASWAAAGMLSPGAEVAPGEDALLDELRAAALLWPAFAARLAALSGVDVDYAESGSLLVGTSVSDTREAGRLAGVIADAGIEVVRLSAPELAGLEPSLAAGRGGGWLLPGDHRVDNRLLVDGLLASLKALGVRILEDRCVELASTSSAIHLELEHQGSLDADACVLATGATAPLRGAEDLGLPHVRPVRGTTLRLGAVTGVQVPARTIRAVVDGLHCYLVPRRDGSLIVGATTEEQGYVQIARAGGVAELLEAARTVLPCVEELSFDEAAVGLRPATADHLPFVGRLRDPRVVGAVGHHRNGVLLAPRAGVVARSLLCPDACG